METNKLFSSISNPDDGPDKVRKETIKRITDKELTVLREKKKSNLSSWFWLSFTFLTVSFFLVAAIRPTLLTIARLQRELKEKTVLDQQLQKKIKALVEAQEIFSRNIDNLYLLEEALPSDSGFSSLVSFFEKTSSLSGTTILAENLDRINSGKNKNEKPEKSLAYFPFSLKTEGQYFSIKNLLSYLENYRRALTINNITIDKKATPGELTEDNLSKIRLDISGSAYYFNKKTIK